MALNSRTLPIRPLGRSGLQLSVLGLGTVKLGRNTDVKYPQDFELPSDEAILNLLEVAGSLGINYLDTAPAYGLSEVRLGALLPHCASTFQIVTKAGEHYDPAQQSRYDFSEYGLRQSIETSLKRLNRTQLDVVLLHSDGYDDQVLDAGALRTLLACKSEGLIQAVGLSGKTLQGGRRALAEGADVLMITLNPDLTDEAALVSEAVEAGAGLLIKKALGSGHLAAHEDPAVRLATLLEDTRISSAVIGTLNPDHLRHNCSLLFQGEPQ